MSRLHRGDIPLKLLETPLNVVKYYIEVVLRAPKVTSFWPKSAKIGENREQSAQQQEKNCKHESF